MSEEAAIRLENLKRLRLTSGQLQERAGRSPSFWSDLLRGKKSFGEKLARDLEEDIGLPRGWLDTLTANEPAPKLFAERMAQSMSHPPFTVPKTMIWGGDEMKNGGLPVQFESAAPDDSMAPKVRKGDMVRYRTDLELRSGDGVLIADDAGNFYVRQYRPRRPDHWEAHALDPKILPLDSKRDGLRVLAVVEWAPPRRWSEE